MNRALTVGVVVVAVLVLAALSAAGLHEFAAVGVVVVAAVLAWRQVRELRREWCSKHRRGR